jgi:hypothetical protein
VQFWVDNDEGGMAFWRKELKNKAKPELDERFGLSCCCCYFSILPFPVTKLSILLCVKGCLLPRNMARFGFVQVFVPMSAVLVLKR